MKAMYDIPVNVAVRVGKVELPMSQLLKIGRGAVLELDRKFNDPVDLIVNGKIVARGELAFVDENLAVSITEVFSRGEED
jgi:flagellar motor switch protein FliN/FliY